MAQATILYNLKTKEDAVCDSGQLWEIVRKNKVNKLKVVTKSLIPVCPLMRVSRGLVILLFLGQKGNPYKWRFPL